MVVFVLLGDVAALLLLGRGLGQLLDLFGGLLHRVGETLGVGQADLHPCGELPVIHTAPVLARGAGQGVAPVLLRGQEARPACRRATNASSAA
jgi:hypothetical protein